MLDRQGHKMGVNETGNFHDMALENNEGQLKSVLKFKDKKDILKSNTLSTRDHMCNLSSNMS